MKVKITSKDISLEAELYDNPTAKKIIDILPIEGTVQTWGDEIYFDVNTHMELDDSQKEVVELGELGFWPTGDCFCIFFGQQPVSAVNIFGKIDGNLDMLKKINSGYIIKVEKA